MAKIRDGSTGELSDGYWCCQVIAARRGSADVVPLYQGLYSQAAPDFESENEEILRAIDLVAERTGSGESGSWIGAETAGRSSPHSSNAGATS